MDHEHKYAPLLSETPRQRTLKDYRPQHDRDCEAQLCGHMVAGIKECGFDWGQHRLTTSHGFTSKPCSCGLDALLTSTPERSNLMKEEEIMRDSHTDRDREADPRGDLWRPIETAPRNGEWFLAWCYDGGHYVYRMGPGFLTGEEPTPTHWQPLPAPPPSQEAK